MNFLIVDSEITAREELERAISLLLPSYPPVSTDSVTSAREAILVGGIDAVFIDPDSPCGKGLEFIGELRSLNMPVVVVSSREDFAVAAFDFEAFDYLLKPISPERLMRAIAKVRRHTNKNPAQRLVVFSDQHHCWPVPLVDVIMAEGEGSYVMIHVRGRRPILVCRTLKEVEILLGDQDYVRVNRRQVVRLQAILSIKRGCGSGFSAEVEDCGSGRVDEFIW
jgi:two-component system LytT family response regulator